MSRLKKILIGLLIFVGGIAVAGGVIFFLFVQEMKGDPKEEEKVRQQAEQYVREHFEAGTTSVYDVFYDNMGNFGYFEYAANVHHEEYGTNFLVYFDKEKGQMVDTFISAKWRDEAEKAIQPYINEKLGESLTLRDMEPIIHSDDWDEIEAFMKGKIELNVLFDDGIGKELDVDPNNPVSYTELGASPDIIIVTIPRKKQASDEAIFNDIIQSLQDDGILKHGNIRFEYYDMGVPLEEDVEKSF